MNGELDVTGGDGHKSEIAAGTVSGGKMVFGPSDAAEFDWTGGTLSSIQVDVQANTVFHMSGPGDKELRGTINDYAQLSDWNGEGNILLNGQSVFDVKPGANFSVNAGNDVSISVVLGSKFWNEGNVSSSLPSGKTFGFPAPGWVVNEGTWNVVSGDAATRRLRNSGGIYIGDDRTFKMGSGGGVPGETLLDSTQGSVAYSVIFELGPLWTGKATFMDGSTVTITGDDVGVQNVDDVCSSVAGTGNLYIYGNYNWKYTANGQSSVWSGTGTTTVGNDNFPNALLALDAGDYKLQRQLVNNAKVTWIGGLPGAATATIKLELVETVSKPVSWCFWHAISW